MNLTPVSCALACLLASCSARSDRPAPRHRGAAQGALHPVSIATPSVLRGLPVADAGALGSAAVVPCATCHGLNDPTPLPDAAQEIAGPHRGLTVRHGTLRCAACHETSQRDRLHLADGRSIPLIEALELCSQCHGPQRRDYDHGAHGGMRGYWDRTRGPRERNHCVSCHDPHAPHFGKFAPVPGARDRFTAAGSTHE